MAVFDTNIIIDFLNGHQQAADFLQATRQRLVSVVTVAELLAGCATDSKKREMHYFIRHHLEVHEVTYKIGEIAAEVRRMQRIKLPDALIAATAIHEQCQLATRNTKDFSRDLPYVCIPYQLN